MSPAGPDAMTPPATLIDVQRLCDTRLPEEILPLAQDAWLALLIVGLIGVLLGMLINALLTSWRPEREEWR